MCKLCDLIEEKIGEAKIQMIANKNKANLYFNLWE